MEGEHLREYSEAEVDSDASTIEAPSPTFQREDSPSLQSYEEDEPHGPFASMGRRYRKFADVRRMKGMPPAKP